ncbi:hypothetical protein [Halosimplex salinum]|uniref:hypothetical protein n=1 Tax=Halosimplex salinum TaxID=1710538 RepID=UPI000F464E82|nr:hypothetical protein [Halosimplex salinum]
MVDLTIFEVHLDDAQFTANAPNSGEGGPADEATSAFSFGGDESDEADATDSGRPGPFGIVFAFVGLILLTVVLRRILGGSGEPVVEE